MKNPFENDPFSVMYAGFEKLYPGKNPHCVWVSWIKIKWEQKQWAAMPKWIPVTERFPEPVSAQTRRKTKPVLLYSPKGGFYVGWYFGKDYRGHLFTNRTSRDSRQYITTKITHWMPLPEPPKEEDDG